MLAYQQSVSYIIAVAPISVALISTSVLQEDQNVGFEVLTMEVTDCDLDPNGPPFLYDIIDANEGNAFSVTAEGKILTRASFDRQRRDRYDLTVRVFDNGTSPLFSDTLVHINIIEASMYPPNVTPSKVEVMAGSGGQFCSSSSIGQIRAQDDDQYDILRYSLMESPTTTYFRVDRESGRISVAECLDAGVYKLNVSVTDRKFTVFSEVTVKVKAIEELTSQGVVVLRFKNLDADAFYTHHHDRLLKALQRLLKVGPRAIRVVGVKSTSPGNQRSHSNARVRRQATSGDLEVVITVDDKTVEDVVDLLDSSQDELEHELGVSLDLGNAAVCPPDTCSGHGTCQVMVEFIDGPPVTIETDEGSFVSPPFQLQHSCQCDLEFTGRGHLK